MHACRLHVTGASGAGTTSLGRALAAAWAVPHADVDDYYWQPTVPPYALKRPEAERLALMEALFAPRATWVLSGSLMGWGDALADRFDAVLFLALDAGVRLARLTTREQRRYGNTPAPDAPPSAEHRAFMDWAAGYDDPTFAGRSRKRHDAWLAGLSCPVLTLDSADGIAQLVAAVRAWDPGEATSSE